MTPSSIPVQEWPSIMGVRPGDTIQLMADVTRMAWNARRAGQPSPVEGLLDAFVDAVGPTGTLLVPTYNFDLHDGDAFDIRQTRSISGVLANAAIQHPRFKRTPHALHSFAVTGEGTENLVNSNEPSSFGPGSPFAFLLHRKASLIAIDLPLNDAITFAHFTEEATSVPYRHHRPIRLRYTGTDGNTSERTFSIYAKRPGHHLDFSQLEYMAAHDGAITHHDLNGSKAFRLSLPWVHTIIEHQIRSNDERRFHEFRWSWWLRDHTKNLLRTFGFRTRQERTAHAARTA